MAKKSFKSGKRQLKISVSVIAALLIAALSAAFFINKKDTINIKEPVFISTMGQKQSYRQGCKLKYNKDDMKTELIAEDRSFSLNSIPVYYENKEALVLSAPMIFSNYSADMVKKVNHFAIIKKEGDICSISTDGRKYKEVGNSWLHDGGDVYLFLEPVTVSWGENENMKSLRLSPLSYIAVFNNQGFYYYSYQDKQSEFVQSGEDIVYAKPDSGDYTLNMSNDIADIHIFNNLSMLLPPSPDGFGILE
ncbi:MAG: hypothetical protein Q4B86_04820 [Eubacteriales bacterium]|nr:hypothetical protein [Eubacteriales bacterium]